MLVSICIPVLTPDGTFAGNLRRMLASERSDFEVLIGDFTEGKCEELSRMTEEMRDARLRVIPLEPDGNANPALDASACWNAMMPHARGAWISIIGTEDYADPDLGAVIEAMVKRVPDADALSWGQARYVPPALRSCREIAKIPTGSRMILPEQKDMMRGLFYWEAASDRPACHFGAWHGAVRRDLLERIREAFSGVWFEQAAPGVDNICKTVMLARRMVFWERPLSVESTPVTPAGGVANEDTSPFPDFPFSASAGRAARTSLAIEAFKRRYGIELEGWEDSFIQACARDCDTAVSGEQFHARKSNYAHAILTWRGKRAMAGFKPEFKRKPGIPRFQGVKDNHLYFDMDMDQTQTAADFYRLIDSMLFPVHLLDDKLA